MESESEALLTYRQMEVFQELLNSLYIIHRSIQLSYGCNVGENFLGCIIKAKVNRTETDLNESLYFILKCGPREEMFRKSLPIKEIYKREIQIYTKVLVEYANFQSEKGIPTPFKSYPNFYASLEEGNEMLILENMNRLGFKHWPRRQSLDYDHVLLIIKEYAKFHALSYALRDKKPNMFKEITNEINECVFQLYCNEEFWLLGKHRISNALKALDSVNDKQVYDKFKVFSEIMCKSFLRIKNLDNPYAVINHVDCGIMNFLFKYEDSSTFQKPKEVCILDFQHSKLDSPAVDLCAFIFSNTDRSLRLHFDDLILEYYNCFCSFLKQLGSDGEKLLPFKVLQDQLKNYGILGLYTAIHLLYVNTGINQRFSNIFSDGVHSFLYELHDRSLFDTRVRDSILDFDRFGFNFF